MDISVVIPVYGCPGALPELHRRLTETLSSIAATYEIILVDDRCPQGSWQKIQGLSAQDEHVIGVQLSRNFGQSRAITAGLELSCGDWVVVMDCDLQDPPEAIADLYEKAKEGYDIVFARRCGRKDSKLTLAFSRAYYRLYSYLAETPVDPEIGNFSIASRKAIDAFLSLNEQSRDYSLFMTWIGFEQCSVDISAQKRAEGKSSYTFDRKVALAIETITSHSEKPLALSVSFGFLISILSFIVLIAIVIQRFINPEIDAGWPSIIASIFLMGGLIIAVMGMVGVYVGKTFSESKRRPLYLIESIVGPVGTPARSVAPVNGNTANSMADEKDELT